MVICSCQAVPTWLLTALSAVACAQSETQPPQELVAMIDEILGLLQYLGIAVLIGGMIYTVIQLATADTPEE